MIITPIRLMVVMATLDGNTTGAISSATASAAKQRK